MKLLKRKHLGAGFESDDTRATKLANRIIHQQTQLANYLNRKTEYWSKASKLIALFLFCLLFGSGCLYLIIKAFY
jgi:hypothetical protein